MSEELIARRLCEEATETIEAENERLRGELAELQGQVGSSPKLGSQFGTPKYKVL